MNKRNMSLILVTVGVIVYFLPVILGVTGGNNQMIGALFAIGGLIIWYLPGVKGKK